MTHFIDNMRKLYAGIGVFLLTTPALAQLSLEVGESQLDKMGNTKKLVHTAVDMTFTWGGMGLVAGGLFVFIKSLIDKENRTIHWKALVGAILGAGMASMAGEVASLIGGN